MANAIYRLPETLRLRGKSKTRHYADVAEGLFPPPIPLGPRAVGWPEDEVAAVTTARAAGYSDSQIRELVAALVAARQRKALEAIERATAPAATGGMRGPQ